MDRAFANLRRATFAYLYYFSISVAVGGEPSVTELIRQAPAIKSGDEQQRRIKACGYFEDFTFVAMYRSPNHFLLCLAERKSGTPFAYVNENKLLMYNPVDEKVMCISEANFDFSFYFHDGHFYQSFKISKSTGKSSILIDVKSLFEGKAEKDEVIKEDERVYRLCRRTQRGDNLVAIIDSARRCPFKQISLTAKGIEEPMLSIRELSVDEDVQDPWPQLPSKDRFVGKVQLADFSQDPMFEALAGSFILRSLSANAAMQSKELRVDYENRYNGHGRIDWTRVEAYNRRASQTIREVLGTVNDIEKGKNAGATARSGGP
jgi:hypothetical protein